jgi:hypothetical protein
MTTAVPLALPPAFVQFSRLHQSTLNSYAAHVLALYTQTQGGWRTGKPMCLVQAADVGGCPPNVDTVVQFQTGVQDTDGMYSATSPTQLTVQTTGWYRIVLQIKWDTTAGGRRACKIMVNGYNPGVNSIASDARDLGPQTLDACEGFAHLPAFSTIYANIWQSSATTAHLLTTKGGSFMSVEWICP